MIAAQETPALDQGNSRFLWRASVDHMVDEESPENEQGATIVP